MGFFDLFKARSTKTEQSPTPTGPGSKVAKAAAKSGAAQAPVAMAALLPRLLEAREALEAKDLAKAFSLYQEVLEMAGDRADVLAGISGDLGSHGYADKIVELVSPYYDAQRHGPATGINVLQAYLMMRDGDSAQQVLALLRALGRPELEERLTGFEAVIAELIEGQKQGAIPAPLTPQSIADASKVKLVTISKPIWYYGLEALAGAILPPKTERARRVAIGQLAVLGLANAGEKMRQPEEELGRLSRSIPLWLNETLYFSPNYAPVAAIGLLDNLQGANHYALFSAEWTLHNIKQLLDSSTDKLDFLFTGSLQLTEGQYELTVRLWEVKHLRERKTWTATWTTETRDEELGKFQEAFRVFMEFAPYPAGQGLAYSSPQGIGAWLDTLGASLSLFLGEKGLLPKELLVGTPRDLEHTAVGAAASVPQSFAWITLKQRAVKLGLAAEVAQPLLSEDPLVAKALVS